MKKMFRLLKKFMMKKSQRKKMDKSVEEQANDYFPVQSPSERAAGHPLVGTA